MAAALLKVVALRLSTSTRQITLVGTIVLGYDVTYLLLQFRFNGYTTKLSRYEDILLFAMS